MSTVINKGDIVLYKGVKYKVEFAGKTKFGFRAKLSYLNGSKEFWVNLADLTPVSQVEPQSHKTQTVKEAIEKIKKQAFDLGEGTLKANLGDGESADLGTVKKLHFDLGPPDVYASTYPSPKKDFIPPPPPTYATTTQIAAIKKLFPNRSYAVPLEKLSFVEADKMIRARLAEM